MRSLKSLGVLVTLLVLRVLECCFHGPTHTTQHPHSTAQQNHWLATTNNMQQSYTGLGCFAVPSTYVEVPQLKGLEYLNCKVSVFNTNTDTCNVRYLEWVWGIPSLQTGCGPLHSHWAIRLLHHGHSMHEMTNNRFKVLRREFNLHFDSGMRTKDDGMGLKHLHIELDILMWVDGNLIESNFMDINTHQSWHRMGLWRESDREQE